MTAERRQLICEYLSLCTSKIITSDLEFRRMLRWRRRRARNKMRKYWFWYTTRILYSNFIVQPKAKPGDRGRRIWMHERNNRWWNVAVPKFTEKEWIENFRMTKEVFQQICETLNPLLQAKPNPLSTRESINTEKKVAISLFFLAHGCSLRIVGDHFGIHKSTVCVLIRQFADAVIGILMPAIISMPDKQDASVISKNFEEICGIPQIIGCIDSLHIHIMPPLSGYGNFLNSEAWTSIILQAIIDDSCGFRNITCKNPGSQNNSAVLKDSNLYKQHFTVFPSGAKIIENNIIPYLIVGDHDYPNLQWVLKKYPDFNNRKLSEAEIFYNERLDMVKDIAKKTFNRLRGRWQRLLRCGDVDYTFVPRIIATCCALHNIVESRNQFFDIATMTAVEQTNANFRQPVAALIDNKKVDNNYVDNDFREFSDNQEFIVSDNNLFQTSPSDIRKSLTKYVVNAYSV